MKCLDHANVAHATDYFYDEAKETIHLVMRYVEGYEILDVIAEQQAGFYTEEKAKDLFM